MAGMSGRASAEHRGREDDPARDHDADPPAHDYDVSAGLWFAGPERLYNRLAGALVATCPGLAGTHVLDVGAGTGAVSRAVRSAGSLVTATDAAAGMLAHNRDLRPPAVAGDARRLPFRAQTFDAVLLGFVLNNLLEPAQALAEAARVARPRGLVAASTFHAKWTHPAKQAVDTVAAEFGHHPPAWYHHTKESAAALTGSPTALAGVACTAGLERVTVKDRVIDTDVDTPTGIVAWRLGMAHLAPFVTSLSPTDRRRLTDAAVAAVGPTPERVRPRVLILTARTALE